MIFLMQNAFIVPAMQHLYSNLFVNTSNISNVEYYNTWYGRKTTFNLKLFRYLKDKLIDSYTHKFKTEILPNCFQGHLFYNLTYEFQGKSTDSLPMFIIFVTLCLSDIVLML